MDTTAKRTQIYLSEELYRQAQAYAHGKRLSMAAVVRVALQDLLARKYRLSGQAYERDPLWKLIGKAKSREGDLSTFHDTYLYERSRASVSSE